MDWIIENIVKGIWGFFADLASSLIDLAFEAIVKCVIQLSDLNMIINTDRYLLYAQAIAGSLLIVAVVWKGLKNQAGYNDDTNRSIGVLGMKVIMAGSAIFLLPFLVKSLVLPLNNNLVLLIQSLGSNFTQEKFTEGLSLTQNLGKLSGDIILIFLVLAVAFVVLGIQGAIRYIELVICVLMAPFSAISIVNDSDGVQVWAREMLCIVFTQSIHVLLLQFLLEIMKTQTDFLMGLMCIATVVVMIKGPKVLRTFLYSTGIGSASVGAAGQAGRMAAMKTVMKSAKPV